MSRPEKRKKSLILLDHLIVLVNDMDKAVADYTALGFTIQNREDSQHGSAVNRFICLDDGSYILLTAFPDPEVLEKQRLGALLAAGEGWGDYSFVVSSVDEHAQKMAVFGAKTLGPIDVGNTLVDGARWGLKLLLAGRGAGGDDALPFLVEDVNGREFRIPAPVPHSNGAKGVARLIISSPKARETAKVMAELLGSTFGSSIFRGRDAFELDGPCRVTVFEDASHPPIGRIGGGLFAVELTGDDAAKFMDLGKTHGADIAIVRSEGH
jgi:catechol 2,3-dioxygenase-like lactoylglutathione lyase family enzyme